MISDRQGDFRDEHGNRYRRADGTPNRSGYNSVHDHTDISTQ
jgi:hypothetical protein